MDYMNELIHEEGKFNKRGYPAFEKEHNVLDNVSKAIALAREKGYLVVFVKFGFTPDYKDAPKHSPLFALAKKFGAVQLGTWATEFHEKLDVREEDKVIIKHCVSPFYGTYLDAYLRVHGVDELFICGVSTDLVVQSTAREGHDRDYKIHVLSDCCVAGSIEDHKHSLQTLGKIGVVGTVAEVL